MSKQNQGKTWRLVFRYRTEPTVTSPYGELNTDTAIAQNCSKADAVKAGKRRAEERGGDAGKYWFMGAEAVTQTEVGV